MSEGKTCPICNKPLIKTSRWWRADCDHTAEEWKEWAVKKTDMELVELRK